MIIKSKIYDLKYILLSKKNTTEVILVDTYIFFQLAKYSVLWGSICRRPPRDYYDSQANEAWESGDGPSTTHLHVHHLPLFFLLLYFFLSMQFQFQLKSISAFGESFHPTCFVKFDRNEFKTDIHHSYLALKGFPLEEYLGARLDIMHIPIRFQPFGEITVTN